MQFTIAIPAFKSNFLKDCIDSVLKQTIEDFELIIVNDQSPQPIDEIINEFSDPRISYYKNGTNIGAENLVNNWNNCLQKAQGDFFVMMGDDDRMEPDYLEEFLRLIGKYPDLDVYHCRSIIIDENSEAFKLTPSWPEYESVYDNMWHRLSGYRLQYISDFVYRTDALKKNGGFFFLPLAWGSDDVSAYIACGTKGIAHTNKPVFNYRQTRFTISSAGDNHLKKIEAFTKQQEWLEHFLKTAPENKIDRITWGALLPLVKTRFKKEKIHLVSKALAKSRAKNLKLYLSTRQQHNFSVPDLLKALIRSQINAKKYRQ